MKRPDIEQEGIITGISESHIFVRIIQHSACAGCHAASLCTTTDQKEKIIEVEKCDFPIQIGDKVSVALSASAGYRAIWFTAALPVILIMLSLVINERIGMNELYSGLCTLVVLAVYYTILYFYRNRLKKRFRFFLKPIHVS